MSTAEDDSASEYKISRISFQENPSLRQEKQVSRRRPAQPIVKKRSHSCNSNRCRCSLIDRDPEELAPGSEYKANTREIRKHDDYRLSFLVSPVRKADCRFFASTWSTVAIWSDHKSFDAFFNWSINKIFFFWLIKWFEAFVAL